MKSKRFQLLAIVIAALICFAATANLRANLNDTESKRVVELKQQRIAVLQKLADQVEILYKAGRLKFEETLQAREELFSAQLDLETDPDKRVELYEKRLEIFQFEEDAIAARVEVGEITTDQHLRATAQRLLAEIELAREIAK